jgi:hypothetical protein
MLNEMFNCLGSAINYLARPVDAIKHQAKTVTVGTSRISERVEGILFEALAAENFGISQLTAQNIIVLKNLQGIISQVTGSIVYRIEGLNLLSKTPLPGSKPITSLKEPSVPLSAKVMFISAKVAKTSAAWWQYRYFPAHRLRPTSSNIWCCSTLRLKKMPPWRPRLKPSEENTNTSKISFRKTASSGMINSLNFSKLKSSLDDPLKKWASSSY